MQVLVMTNLLSPFQVSSWAPATQLPYYQNFFILKNMRERWLLRFKQRMENHRVLVTVQRKTDGPRS